MKYYMSFICTEYAEPTSTCYLGSARKEGIRDRGGASNERTAAYNLWELSAPGCARLYVLYSLSVCPHYRLTCMCVSIFLFSAFICCDRRTERPTVCLSVPPFLSVHIADGFIERETEGAHAYIER